LKICTCEDNNKTKNSQIRTKAELQSAASITSDTDIPTSAAAEIKVLYIECASKMEVSMLVLDT